MEAASAATYLSQHEIPQLVDALVARLVRERPANPRGFLAKELGDAAAAPQRAAEKLRPAVADDPPVGMVVTLADEVIAEEDALATTRREGIQGSEEAYFVPPAHSWDSGQSADRSFALYQAHNTKTVWFLRHGQAAMNPLLARAGEDDEAVDAIRRDRSLWDAELTPKGRAQCGRLADAVEGIHGPVGFRPQLVVTSPLRRSLDTAVGVVGAPAQYRSGGGELTSREEQGEGRHMRDAAAVKWVATELCRERVTYTYNGRSTVTELKQRYPWVDFSSVPHDTDELMASHQEPEQGPDMEAVVGERAEAFMKWLMMQRESRIFVVTNATFLRALFRRLGYSLSDTETRKFNSQPHNCEMRRVVVCPQSNPRKMKLKKCYRDWIVLPDSRFEE